MQHANHFQSALSPPKHSRSIFSLYRVYPELLRRTSSDTAVLSNIRVDNPLNSPRRTIHACPFARKPAHPPIFRVGGFSGFNVGSRQFHSRVDDFQNYFSAGLIYFWA